MTVGQAKALLNDLPADYDGFELVTTCPQPFGTEVYPTESVRIGHHNNYNFSTEGEQQPNTVAICLK